MKLPTLRRPRALLFDLDGTLLDSRLDIAAACNHALVAFGRLPLDEAQIATFVGDGARTLIARAFGMGKEDPAVTDALEVFLEFYAAHPVARSRWMPGAREALAALSGRPLGIVTNKTRQVTARIVEALGLGATFGTIVAGGDTDLKPSGAPVLRAAAELGVAAAEVWLIGDGVQDIGAARASGAVAVAVRGGFHAGEKLQALGPDVLLDTLDELVPLVAAADAA